MIPALNAQSASYNLEFSKTLTDGEYDSSAPICLPAISKDATPEEIFANVELKTRKVFADYIIKYAENLHATIVLTNFSDYDLALLEEDVKAQIDCFFPDVQNRIKNIIWRLCEKPDEDPIACGNLNLTVDLASTAIALYLAGRLETENLDDRQIDDLMDKVIDNSMPRQFPF